MSTKRMHLVQKQRVRAHKRASRSWTGLGLLIASIALATATGCGEGDGDADGTGSTNGTGGNNNSDLGNDLSSSGGTDGGTDGAIGGNGGDCGGQEVTAEPVVANVLFVIDKSLSMDTTPDGFTNTKWDTLVESLGTALTAVEDDIQMGLKLYPSGDMPGDTAEDVCPIEPGVEVEIAAGSAALPDIEAELSTTSPSGQTPTAAALEQALDYFTSGAGATLDGQPFVVLATDGGPNCGTTDSCVPAEGCQPNDSCGLSEAETCTVNIDGCGGTACPEDGSYCLFSHQCLDDDAAIAAITALAEEGIPTIVVGMPGSEAYQDVLDAMAVAGGLPDQLTSPKYYKVDDADGLSQTLQDITQGVIRSCDILTEDPPPDPTQVNVFIDGEVIPKNPDNGWQFGDDTNTFIQIVGSYCEDLESSGASSISVEYGCPSVIVVK